MIDPAKSRAAALSLFDASCQVVKDWVSLPDMLNPEAKEFVNALERMNAAARHVVKVNNHIKELEALNQE